MEDGWRLAALMAEHGFSMLVTTAKNGRQHRVLFDAARFPPQQAWLGGRWEPDPLVLDDQALIVDVKDKGLLVTTAL